MAILSNHLEALTDDTDTFFACEYYSCLHLSVWKINWKIIFALKIWFLRAIVFPLVLLVKTDRKSNFLVKTFHCNNSKIANTPVYLFFHQCKLLKKCCGKYSAPFSSYSALVIHTDLSSAKSQANFCIPWKASKVGFAAMTNPVSVL